MFKTKYEVHRRLNAFKGKPTWMAEFDSYEAALRKMGELQVAYQKEWMCGGHIASLSHYIIKREYIGKYEYRSRPMYGGVCYAR